MIWPYKKSRSNSADVDQRQNTNRHNGEGQENEKYADIIRAVNAIANELHAAKKESQRSERKKECREIITIVLVFLTFIAAGAGDWFFNGQLQEMRQSFAADRAYILFSNFIHEAGVIPDQQFSFALKNYGRTPAEIRILAARCDYAVSAPPTINATATIPGITTSEGLAPPGWVIEAGNQILDGTGKLHATAEDIQQAKIGVGKIFCNAVAVYDDMRSMEHKTTVCLSYNFGIDVWVLCPDDRANSHT